MKEILRYLGYKGQDIDEELKIRIQNAIDLFNSNITPRYTWCVFDILAGDNIELAGQHIIFEGKDILNHLKDAEKCR